MSNPVCKNNTDNNNEGTIKVPSVVVRKCCACGEKFDRKQLIRIMTEAKTGKIIINPNSKEFGKSTYLCKNEKCLKIALKRKRLKHLSENDIEKLKKIISQ